MKFCSVSVYRKNGAGWGKSVFKKAFVRHFDGIGFEKGGRYKKGKMMVRIFSPLAGSISVGDMLQLGEGGDVPCENALTITEISNNMNFSLPHIRLTAL